MAERQRKRWRGNRDTASTAASSSDTSSSSAWVSSHSVMYGSVVSPPQASTGKHGENEYLESFENQLLPAPMFDTSLVFGSSASATSLGLSGPISLFEDHQISATTTAADVASHPQPTTGVAQEQPVVRLASSQSLGLDSEELDNDIWTNTSLFRLDGMPQPTRPYATFPDDHMLKNKRTFDDFCDTHTSDSHAGFDLPAFANDGWWKETFPCLFPVVHDLADRPEHTLLPNPFLEGSDNRYPTLENRVTLQNTGVIDGYIKIRFLASNDGESDVSAQDKQPLLRLRQREGPGPNDINQGLNKDQWPGANIPLLPPNFSTGMKLDKLDEKLWCFHLNAYCPGRTLLQDNYWCEQILPIAVKDACSRHALLAFSTSYVLDYQATEVVRERANHHYREGVKLVQEALARRDAYDLGKEDGLVAAIILLLSNDIVNWESRRPKGVEPLWREGVRLARQILDRTDPGFRYWNPINVQSSVARVGNANWVAYTDICAQVVTPLAEENTENLFSWLLAGSIHEAHKIHNATGVCPKLLHIFSQITHLAARVKKDPESTVLLFAAWRIQKRLEKFWQWSDASNGYPSWNDLLSSCSPGEDGKVHDTTKVVELTAHCWVPAAKIYLHCRLYRKPRSHPDVLASLDVLMKCIDLMPCKGPLFTAQSPFFAVFIMAVVVQRPKDRAACQAWFESVLNGAQCRSSVPPVWEAVRRLWHWFDHDFQDEVYDEERPVSSRRPWWEHMVDELVRESGVLCLV